MRNCRVIFKFVIALVLTYTLMACSTLSLALPTPTAIPPTSTPIPTGTKTPVPTETPTPAPTLTSTPTPTVEFYSIDPTIVATSTSCATGFPDEMCVSGLYIVLTGRKLAEYEVVVSGPGFSETVFSCPQQALLVTFGENMAPVICDEDQITFISVGLKEITITINWNGGSVTQTLYPNFEIAAPEGPECEPLCSLGKAEINIP